MIKCITGSLFPPRESFTQSSFIYVFKRLKQISFSRGNYYRTLSVYPSFVFFLYTLKELFLPEQIIPAASASQLTLVDLICALSTLQTERVLQLVKEVVKRPPQIRGDEVRSLGTLPMNAWLSRNLLSYKLCLGRK